MLPKKNDRLLLDIYIIYLMYWNKSFAHQQIRSYHLNQIVASKMF